MAHRTRSQDPQLPEQTESTESLMRVKTQSSIVPSTRSHDDEFRPVECEEDKRSMVDCMMEFMEEESAAWDRKRLKP